MSCRLLTSRLPSAKPHLLLHVMQGLAEGHCGPAAAARGSHHQRSSGEHVNTSQKCASQDMESFGNLQNIELLLTQVADLFVVHLAAHKALAAQKRSKLTTKSLHSELVFNIAGIRHVNSLCTWSPFKFLLPASPRAKEGYHRTASCMVLPCTARLSLYGESSSTPVRLQISESLKRFGVQPDTKHLLVCRFDADDTDVSMSVVHMSGLSCQLRCCACAHRMMHPQRWHLCCRGLPLRQWCRERQ